MAGRRAASSSPSWWRLLSSLVLALLLPLPGRCSGGHVEVLTDETFKTLTSEGDLWLVDFYAPWCGHCKKLEPVLEDLVKQMEPGSMRVGKIDATAHKRTAGEFKLEGYPTIKFKRKGMEFEDYDGGRTVKDFLDFQKKLKGPKVLLSPNPKELSKYVDTHQIVYLLGLPDGANTATTPPPYYIAFEEVADRLRFRAAFALGKGASALGGGYRATPFLAKLEVGEQPVYYPGDITGASRDQINTWVQATNLPLVSELHQANFRKLGLLPGKLLVVGVVDPSDTTRTSAFLNGMKEMARSQRDLVAGHYILGYLDGVRWKGFVRQFNIGDDLPRLFVLDMPKGTFYEDPEVDEIDEIETFLVDIAAGKVPAQRQGAMQATRQIWQQLKDWYPWSTLLLFPVALILSLCLFPSFWALDEEEESAEKKKEAGEGGEGEGVGEQDDTLKTVQEEEEDDADSAAGLKSESRKKDD